MAVLQFGFARTHMLLWCRSYTHTHAHNVYIMGQFAKFTKTANYKTKWREHVYSSHARNAKLKTANSVQMHGFFAYNTCLFYGIPSPVY